MRMSVLLAAAFAALSVCAVSVCSPDGRNELRLGFSPLSYEVYRDGVRVVATSDIGMRVDGMEFSPTGMPRVVRRCREGVVATPVYKKASVNLSGNEAFVDFGTWGLRLVARNDGVAYRFETSMCGRIRVDAERANLMLPDRNATCWVTYEGRYGFEEALNVTERAGDLRTFGADAPGNALVRRFIYLPFVYSVGGKTVAVTESDVRDYPIWDLMRTGSDEAMPMLGSYFGGHPTEVVNDDGEPYSPTARRLVRWKIEKVAPWLVETEGTRTFPWRVFVLADAPCRLCESDIVYALAPPPAPDVDFSWVRPGKVAWEWWNGWRIDGVDFKTGCNTHTYEKYIEFAARHGVEYVILDEGWSLKGDIFSISPDMDVRHLVEYARERNVGIILWLAWAQAFGREDQVADCYARFGIRGFKVDFMDRGDAEIARFMERFAAVAVRHRLLVDYHGAYRPVGLHRKYPNVINYEAVHGLEQMKWNSGALDFVDNDVKSFFCRMTAGPMDYTPGAMDNYPIGKYPESSEGLPMGRNPGSLGTRSHQLALMVAYEAPLQMLCDSPSKYERNAECLEFMAQVPTVWDETVGLGGDPDSYAAVARRRGGVWYVAAFGNRQTRKVEIATSFLGKGQWTADVFCDCPESVTDGKRYLRKQKRVTAGDVLSFQLTAGGGVVMCLKRTGQP